MLVRISGGRRENSGDSSCGSTSFASSCWCSGSGGGGAEFLSPDLLLKRGWPCGREPLGDEKNGNFILKNKDKDGRLSQEQDED